jgi:dihydrofolate reductase
MKVILYMATSANGHIAKQNDDTSFVSEVEWKSFDKMGRAAKNTIMGRKTYDVCRKIGQIPFPDRLNIVVSKKKLQDPRVTHCKSPQEALQLIKKKGYKTALVGGGGELNASFLQANLIDEIYLDIEPVLLGKGIKLFADCKTETKLKLLGMKKLSKDEVQLHYKVLA